MVFFKIVLIFLCIFLQQQKTQKEWELKKYTWTFYYMFIYFIILFFLFLYMKQHFEIPSHVVALSRLLLLLTNKAAYFIYLLKVLYIFKMVFSAQHLWRTSSPVSCIIWCWGCSVLRRSSFLLPLTSLSLSDAQRMSFDADANWLVSLSIGWIPPCLILVTVWPRGVNYGAKETQLIVCDDHNIWPAA